MRMVARSGDREGGGGARMKAKLVLSGLAVGGLAAGSMAAIAPQAAAAAPIGGAGQVVRVCPAPRPGDAACMALAVARPDGKITASARPLASAFTPADIQKAYDLTGLKSGGRTVAIVDAGGYGSKSGASELASDLAKFRSTYKLPPCTVAGGCLKVMNQTGGAKLPASQGWELEEALDLDSVSSACPDCKIDMVQAAMASLADLGKAEDTAAKQPGVVAINNSYGGKCCDAANNAAYDHPGIAVVASGGDDAYDGTPGFPSSDSDVVAVGGTSLVASSSARGYAESVWYTQPGEGTGSGCSTLNPRPAWQPKAVTKCGHRALNDVSAVADPDNGGLAVYCSPADCTSQGGGWFQVGGTSEASPIIAGVFALSGNTKGYPAKNLYAAANSKYLYDITKGSNGTCTPKIWCTAGKGWDGPTGNGTPHGAKAF